MLPQDDYRIGSRQNQSCVHTLDKDRTVFDKPISLGFTVLELDILLMHKLYCDKFQFPWQKENLQLLYMDSMGTDSFKLYIRPKHSLIEELKQSKTILISVNLIHLMSFR